MGEPMNEEEGVTVRVGKSERYRNSEGKNDRGREMKRESWLHGLKGK